MKYLFRQRWIHLLVGSALLLGGVSTSWADNDTIKFAEPSWPGVNIKTEVVTQLLETFGYQTKTTHLTLPFISRGLSHNSTDVFLGYWLPADKNMFDERIKDKKIKSLGLNLTDAKEGLSVPAYTWKKGIHSVKDLAKHGDRFDHKIYSIEAGSALSQAFKKAVDNDYEGLGGWKVVATSTAAMLAQVKRSTDRNKPIVFFGWQPHWMDVAFDLRFLKDKKGSKIASIPSQVGTLVNAEFPKKHPNVARLLSQFKVDVKTQSHWIYQYSHEKKKKTEVAQSWLKGHEDKVAKWLDGVKTADGKSAMKAYRQKYL